MENFDQYTEYTKNNDWNGICKLNNTKLDPFGTKKELKVLPNYIEDDEVIFALTSGVMKQTDTSNSFDFGVNTWLVVLTNERFLFIDSAMLSSSVDTQSVRHEHVQAVSSSQGLLLGKIMIDLGSRTIIIDNCPKLTVSVIAGLANKWYRELEENTKTASAIKPSVGTPFDKLEKLVKLHSFGALTHEEFNMIKDKLLASEEFKIIKQKLLESI